MGNVFGMCWDPSDARHHPLCPQGAIQALLASFILFLACSQVGVSLAGPFPAGSVSGVLVQGCCLMLEKGKRGEGHQNRVPVGFACLSLPAEGSQSGAEPSGSPRPGYKDWCARESPKPTVNTQGQGHKAQDHAQVLEELRGCSCTLATSRGGSASCGDRI